MRQADLDKIQTQLLQALDHDPRSWLKTWTLADSCNLDGKLYNGRNVLLLASSRHANRFTSPYFGTYKALKARGLQVQRGSKATTIFYSATIDKRDNRSSDTGSDTGSEPDTIYILKAYNVFNLDQTTGDKSEFEQETQPTPNLPNIDALLDTIGANIEYTNVNPHYNFATDTIGLPLQFDTITEKYLTLFHELTHWTGHKTRLDRNLKHYATSIKVRAIEELIAESGSAILAMKYGLTVDVTDNTKAYISNWVDALKRDPKQILDAFAQATKAVNFIDELATKHATIKAS